MSYMKTVSGLLFTLLLMLAPLAAAASEPTVEFDTLSHDFGNIKATGGPVSCEYKFTNTGTTPLVIVSVTNGGSGGSRQDRQDKNHLQPRGAQRRVQPRG